MIRKAAVKLVVALTIVGAMAGGAEAATADVEPFDNPIPIVGIEPFDNPIPIVGIEPLDNPIIWAVR